MKFSIITVCYNCESLIEKTMQSLLQQDYPDYEYIVVDGSSKDETFQLVQEYKRQFKQITAISEPDDGIYDAMNKGTQIAKGDYVFFLNAGDRLLNRHVLSQVAEQIERQPDAGVYYGTILRGGKMETYPSRITRFYLIYLERMICHQAMFIKRVLMQQYPYDTQFSICADREWLIRMIKKRIFLVYMPKICVGEYDTSGVSSQYIRCAADSKRVVAYHGGSVAVAFVEAKRFVGRLLRHSNRRI